MNKTSITGLTLILTSALIWLAQTMLMPGMLQSMREGHPDPLFVPLAISVFASYLAMPLGILLFVIGLVTNSAHRSAQKRKEKEAATQETPVSASALNIPEP